MNEVQGYGGEQEEASEQKKPFALPVEIGGLSYDFQGEMVQKPGSFKWKLAISDWQKQLQAAEAALSETAIENRNPFLEAAIHQFAENQGEIAALDAELARDFIRIMHVAAQTWILPEKYGYKNAKGTASFLLKNFLTYADSKKLPVFLEPYPDGSSPLSDDELIKWYQRNGFDWRYKNPDAESLPSKDYGSMVRMPQEPDKTLELYSLLSEVESSSD